MAQSTKTIKKQEVKNDETRSQKIKNAVLDAGTEVLVECVTPKMKELFKNLILNMKLNGTKEDEDKVENIESNYEFDKTIKEIAHYYAGIGERNMEKAVRSTLRAFGNEDEDIDYIMSTANNVLAAAKEENKKILEQSSD